MVLKVCYSNQIHRISKTPASFKELAQIVQDLFQNQLPERWTLQYLDSDNDTIMLSDEHDFHNLLDGELSDSNSKAVKIFVTAVDAIDQSHLNNQSSAQQSVTDSVSEKQDDFLVIERRPSLVLELPKTVAEEPKVVQPVEEAKPVEEIPQVAVQQEVVAEKLAEEPKVEEGRKRCMSAARSGKEKHRVKKILKKLNKNDISAEKKEHLESKLRKLEANLKPENQEKYFTKKEKFIQKMVEKKAKAEGEFRDKVTDIIYQHLPTIASLAKEFVQEEKKPQENVNAPEIEIQITKTEVLHPQVQSNGKIVHNSVTCDGCSAYPLTGIRYKCLNCPDFDFCETCEANKEHPHPFIKVKTLEQSSNLNQRQRRHQDLGGARCRFSRLNQERTEGQQEGHCKWRGFNRQAEDLKNTDGIKNLIGAFLGQPANQTAENKEKAEKDAKDLFNAVPEDVKINVTDSYENLPQNFKGFVNSLFGNLPESIFGQKSEKKPQEAKVEEPKKDEVIISEEPVATEVQAEVIENASAPVIQVVENVPEVKEEPKVQKKEYSKEVEEKAAVLKEVFSDVDEQVILEFVSKAPFLNIQELVENFLSL